MKAAQIIGDSKNLVIGIGALVAVSVVVYIALRGFKGVASDAGKAVIDTAAGAVEGIAAGVGIPKTNQTECQKALAEGRYWDASFACPAGDFLSGVFGGGSTSPPPTKSGSNDGIPAVADSELWTYY